MRARSAANWIVLGLSFLGILLVIRILAAIWLRPVVAAPALVPRSFFSALFPDYGPDELSGRFFSLRVLPEMEQELQGPVPTATWRNFAGDPPFTATPTPTPTSTNTPTPTNTPTSTPTRTPTRTPTEKPEKKEKTEPPPPSDTPTITPSPTPPDTQDPSIVDSGVPDPGPGDLTECAAEVLIDGLHVTDPPISYGIAWVKLKYKVSGKGEDLSGFIFSNPLALISGGEVDGGWDAIYAGEIIFEIDTDWPSPFPDPFVVELHAKVVDNGGHSDTHFYGEYTIPASCGGPTPTPSPPPSPTPGP